MTNDKKTATELAEIRTHLAARRTLMAIDRTLMAWLRTALSMISFGFTIYKILQSFQAEGGALPRADTPRNIGLFLIGLGSLAIVMGAVEYWVSMRELQHATHVRLLRASFIMALLIAALGIVLFVGVSDRMF